MPVEDPDGGDRIAVDLCQQHGALGLTRYMQILGCSLIGRFSA